MSNNMQYHITGEEFLRLSALRREKENKRSELFFNAIVNNEKIEEALEMIKTEIEELKKAKTKYPYLFVFIILFDNLYRRFDIDEVNIKNEFLKFTCEIGEFYYCMNKNGFLSYFEDRENKYINFPKIDINNINLIEKCLEEAIDIRTEFDKAYYNSEYYDRYSEESYDENAVDYDPAYQKEMIRLYNVYKTLEKDFYKDLNERIKYKIKHNKRDRSKFCVNRVK